MDNLFFPTQWNKYQDLMLAGEDGHNEIWEEGENRTMPLKIELLGWREIYEKNDKTEGMFFKLSRWDEIIDTPSLRH